MKTDTCSKPRNTSQLRESAGHTLSDQGAPEVGRTVAEQQGPEQACLRVGLGPAHGSPRHLVWGGIFRDLLRARDPSCLLSHKNVTAALSLSPDCKPPRAQRQILSGEHDGGTLPDSECLQRPSPTGERQGDPEPHCGTPTHSEAEKKAQQPGHCAPAATHRTDRTAVTGCLAKGLMVTASPLRLSRELLVYTGS